ncbi:MAG: cya [Gemmatimonadetes bacterium]|nr:cya [Gemmatimonadota bacterium]
MSELAFRLVRTNGPESFDIATGNSYVLGRGPSSDLPVPDPTISRRHAELRAENGFLEVTDLGSSNGTQVNGNRVTRGRAAAFDTLTFGRADFRVEPLETGTRAAGGTIVRQVPVEYARDAYAHLDAHSERSLLKLGDADAAARQSRKLELLLDLSQRLSGELDHERLLETIVHTAFEVLAVDRVAILLLDVASGKLVPRMSRSRIGGLPAEAVPRSIVDTVVAGRVAVLSDNAVADSRFTGQSILRQSVRSAMCTPLMATAEQVLGILYVDSVTATNSFSDEDLQFLIAFGGIAAAGIRASMQADELQEQAIVRGSFERYFAPGVAAEIARNAGATRLGGERRKIAVLFSDVRGFTRLAEGMPPEALAKLLSEYFTEMVEVVFEHGGTLDKFVGDAIMALWGAPQAQEDAPDRAVRAALAMQEALAHLNARWLAAGRPALGVGIGINFGEVFVGNIGSHRRLEYTVLGDVVNVAARLCAEAGAGEILVAEGVRAATYGGWDYEALQPMELRGREEKVEVFRVIGAG